MSEYRLDVRPILDEVGAGIEVSDTLDLGTLVVGDESFPLREPAYFHVSVSNAGEAIVAIGSVTAPVRATCARCLCEFEHDIVGEVEGFWPRPGAEVPEEEEISGIVDSEGRIDLAPVLVAALVVEAPYAPLHAEECEGLCATCGADLNVEECACARDEDADHPFAALKDLVAEQSTDERSE